MSRFDLSADVSLQAGSSANKTPRDALPSESLWPIRLLSGLLVISLVLTLGVLVWSAEREDATAAEKSRQLASSAVRVQQRNLENFVFEYTWWNAAYKNLAQSFDPDWYDWNLGDVQYLKDTAGVNGTFVVAPDNTLLRRMHAGDFVDVSADGRQGITEHFQGGIRSLLQQARQREDGEWPAVSDFLQTQGQTVMVSLRVVHPDDDPPRAEANITSETAYVLGATRTLDAALLSRLGREFELTELAFVPGSGEPGEASLPVTLVNGDVAGHFAWKVDWPSQDIYGVILPAVGTVGLVVILAVYGLVVQGRKHKLLYRAKKKAEFDEKCKKEFLAHMSHEIRTPLNSIIGFSEILKNENPWEIDVERYQEYVGMIQDSGAHLLSLINDILDLSKLEAGYFALNETEVYLQEIAHYARRFISPRATAGNVTIDINVPDELPAILADERAIKQILLNLLTNAVKFTPPKGRVSLEAAQTPRGQIKITIQDTGVGIPEDKIPVVLQPFRQTENTLTRHQDGTGLGLPLAASLVEKHGGHMDIQSQVNVGTTIIIILPQERLKLIEGEAQAA